MSEFYELAIHTLERYVLNGVEIVNALQRISTRRFGLRQPMAEISTIARRGRASILQSIHIGCNPKHLGIEAGQFMRMSERSIVLPETLFQRCLVVAANVGRCCRNIVGNVGNNMVPTLWSILEPKAEAMLREDV